MKTDSVTLTDKSKSHKKSKYINSDGQSVRQTDRQTARQTERQTNRQLDRQL